MSMRVGTMLNKIICRNDAVSECAGCVPEDRANLKDMVDSGTTIENTQNLASLATGVECEREVK
jgi:hypothetical protein